jgi:hypothetical protein
MSIPPEALHSKRSTAHDPLVCGLGEEVGLKTTCPGCLAAKAEAEQRAQRREEERQAARRQVNKAKYLKGYAGARRDEGVPPEETLRQVTELNERFFVPALPRYQVELIVRKAYWYQPAQDELTDDELRRLIVTLQNRPTVARALDVVLAKASQRAKA